ncbi:hypothetical protein H5410_037107 [Solanum commersonii]|uniref:Uncharacterized protein n=1 Tax=Solanum commersonii TaxID=4109 RepID=A0A9J5Y5C9_SOLCO|nr:hypothetical protein H5410_037107 [Solanum commersonii]
MQINQNLPNSRMMTESTLGPAHYMGNQFSPVFGFEEVDYEGRIPIKRITALVQKWCGILDSGIGVESWCMPEYYTWFMMAGILSKHRYEGILGFTDTQRSNQIGTELLNLMPITTTMYHQVTPRSVDHIIQVVDDEPNEEMEEDPEENPREPT